MSGMGSRTARIEARIAPLSAERIRYASELLQSSVSGFVVRSALAAAEEVIAQHAYTTVPSDYFKELLAALDAPVRPMPRLSEAARRHRRDPRFQRA